MADKAEHMEGSSDFEDIFASVGDARKLEAELAQTRLLLRLLDERFGVETRRENFRVSIVGEEDEENSARQSTKPERQTGVHTIAEFPADDIFTDFLGFGTSSPKPTIRTGAQYDPKIVRKGRKLATGEIVEFHPSSAEWVQMKVAEYKLPNFELFLCFFAFVFFFALCVGVRAGYKKGIMRAKQIYTQEMNKQIQIVERQEERCKN